MPATTAKSATPFFQKRSSADGTYWTCGASSSAVRHFLRGCRTDRFKTAADHAEWWENHAELKARLGALDPASFAKVANIGGEQEQGFEQAFSSLAYAYIKDKSPRLIDFIVGFQLVERNEDNTKAVGVFGFKVGDQWLYAPVFFLNGDLKGHELLYVKKQDAFVPMKENWVNHLISRRPHVLGAGSDQNTHQLGGLMPNLRRLSQPGNRMKYGSAEDTPAAVRVSGWAESFLPVAFSMATKKAHALYPDRTGDLNFPAVVDAPLRAALLPTAAAFDLGSALADFSLLKVAYDAYRKYPLIKAGFDKFYGVDFFHKTAVAVRNNADSLVTRAEARRQKAAAVRPVDPHAPLIPLAPKLDKNAGLYVYAADATLAVDEDAPGGIKENRPELTDEERAKLLRDTVLIKDDRKDTSIAYDTQVRMELTNPTETGLYEVLEKAGKFDEMVVIVNPHSGRGREEFCVVLRKGSPRDWKNTHQTNLYAKSCDCPTPKDWREYVDGLGGTDSLEKGGTYVAVHANGSGTCPFVVKESFGDGAYAVNWEDYCSWNDRNQALPRVAERPMEFDGYSSYDARLYINQRKGTSLRLSAGELSVPDSYKIIKIKDPPKPKKNKDDSLLAGCCSSGMYEDEGQSEKSPIQPGNLVDIQLALVKQASVLRLHDTGTDVVVKTDASTQVMTKKAALLHLVRDHGLREEQVRSMLKAAAAKQRVNAAVEFLVKYAYGFGDPNLRGGPQAPAFPEPHTGTEQNGYNSVDAIYPQEEELPVDELSAHNTDPSVYDPFYQPDQEAMQTAQQASASGQKEVFDTAMIGGMLKSVRKDSLVDKHLGDLMKALDSVGRILFMFYWHQEEFEDRYGKQDLPELEDTLRNTFETLGDLTLFLKEKTVSVNSAGTGVGTPKPGEPSIDEAAHN